MDVLAKFKYFFVQNYQCKFRFLILFAFSAVDGFTPNPETNAGMVG